MRARWLAFAATLTLCSCGPRQPGPRAGEFLFWRIVSSEVALTDCTDDPTFRSQVQPIAFTANTYLMLRIEKDGKRATPLDCEQLDPGTCQESPSGVVFEVAGHELLYSTESKSPIGTEGCQVQGAQSWSLTDLGQTASLEISNVLSLVDAPTVCPKVEDQVKRQSPNGLGLQGCIVKFTIGARLD